ncbi:hypothetical protein T01_8092 [Trichinella spiralis]|uniref:Uncharacterized protein n=1 Tax=Trichinella spiralis TaxID=6334 RepID=A0A0V1BFK5_TRISP|nr:hypothetical protein T01_8092 [Trichinella spiralis]
MKRGHSKICLPENACKFSFTCYAFVYVALVSMGVGVQYVIRVHWSSPCDDGRRMTLKTALIFIYITLHYFTEVIHLHIWRNVTTEDKQEELEDIYFHMKKNEDADDTKQNG